MIIDSSIYKNSDLYLSAYKQASIDTGNKTTTGKTSEKTTADNAYLVTLSPAVEYAKTREQLGLPPTGKLQLSDFTSAINQDQETVNATVESVMADLGLPSDLKINLSIDDNGKIVTDSDFTGKDALETALNDDDAFVQSFGRLSTNNKILTAIVSGQNYTAEMDLASMMDDSDFEDTMSSIAAKYETIRTAGSPISALLQNSDDDTPFTYTYDPSQIASES